MPEEIFDNEAAQSLRLAEARNEEKKSAIRGLGSLAERLAGILNERIERGEDTGVFLIALGIALAKDSIDIIAALLIFIGVGFVIGPLSFFLSALLVAFLYGKGWFLRIQARLILWVLALAVDSLVPGLGIVPTNVIMVLIAWRNVRREAGEARAHMEELGEMTTAQMTEIAEGDSGLEDELAQAA